MKAGALETWTIEVGGAGDPWPRKDVSRVIQEDERSETSRDVFRPGTRNAVIGGSWTSWLAYERSYRESAVLLTKAALEQNRDEACFYSICFLFRHAFELTLKFLITEATIRLGLDGAAIDHGAVRKKRFTHDLVELLDLADGLLADIPGWGPLDDIRGVVTELNERDPNGATFRYPTFLNEQSTHPNQESIEVAHMANSLLEALESLSAGARGMQTENDEYQDMLREFRDEMSDYYSDDYYSGY